ncbi:uncharacterized protein PAC_10091 [Phialocephala subalpina]|uniref:2EXR domain-containing protein n=1 Tax=Phialocephala subalpina TaxID=576137 RepID=A0A1L7X5C3_9HELO|nr:uncharacterized protein PAC_10091 [Phialocephala subalpina]
METEQILSIFRDELPDPDTILYDQNLYVLDSFTLFSKLPIELRLAIWHLSFKPEAKASKYTNQDFKAWKFPYKFTCAGGLPITLATNQESRSGLPAKWSDMEYLFRGVVASGRVRELKEEQQQSRRSVRVVFEEFVKTIPDLKVPEVILATRITEAKQTLVLRAWIASVDGQFLFNLVGNSRLASTQRLGTFIDLPLFAESGLQSRKRTMEPMDSEPGILNILRVELPDPDILLYIQRMPGQFDSFMLFPKLPVELRLAIWHLTFAPRKIRIKEKVRKDKRQSPFSVYESRTPTPLSLQVNQESRAFGLQYYHILAQNSRGQGRTHYYHSKIDTVSLSMMTPYRVQRLAIEGGSSHLLNAMKSIENLEWHHVWWISFLSTFTGEPEPYSRAFQDVIKEGCFRNLKNMHIMPNQKWRVTGTLGIEGMRAGCIESLRSVFENATEVYPEVKVPSITLGP